MAPELLARLYGGHAADPGDTVRSDQLAGPACVTHIGLVVRDIEQSRQVYADLIGVDVPQYSWSTGSSLGIAPGRSRPQPEQAGAGRLV